MKNKKEKNLETIRRGPINVFISNLTRVLLVLIFIRGCIIGEHSQDF